MSLSDYVKHLRAVNGGLTPWEIAEGSGVPAREIHLIEVKHRRVGENDAVLGSLAEFFKVPVEELKGRREAFRKRLTAFLEESSEEDHYIVLRLEDGEEIAGRLDWYGREAIAIVPDYAAGDEQCPCVVQRSWVSDWRRAGSDRWEVADAQATRAAST
jgi:hypothetical protein